MDDFNVDIEKSEAVTTYPDLGDIVNVPEVIMLPPITESPILSVNLSVVDV